MEPDSRGKNPKANSTNKRVKAKVTKSLGTTYKTASGSKRISPGDGSKPATKTMGPYETLNMKAAKEAAKLSEKRRRGLTYTSPELRAQQKSKKPRSI